MLQILQIDLKYTSNILWKHNSSIFEVYFTLVRVTKEIENNAKKITEKIIEKMNI